MIAEMVSHTKEILVEDIKATFRMTEPYLPAISMIIPDWLVAGGY